MINCDVLFDEEDTRISSVVPIHQNTYVMFSVPHMSSEHHKIINDTLHVVPNNPHPSIDEKSDIPMGVLHCLQFIEASTLVE
jgi:hypothetical protein